MDANQKEVVRALRAIGASVYVIEEPVDLMVGYRRRTVALEVKNRDGRDRLTKQQEEFFATFGGEAYIVHGIQDALEAVKGKA